MEGDDISEPEGGEDEMKASLDSPFHLLAGGQAGVDLHQVHGLQSPSLVKEVTHSHPLSISARDSVRKLVPLSPLKIQFTKI